MKDGTGGTAQHDVACACPTTAKAVDGGRPVGRCEPEDAHDQAKPPQEEVLDHDALTGAVQTLRVQPLRVRRAAKGASGLEVMHLHQSSSARGRGFNDAPEFVRDASSGTRLPRLPRTSWPPLSIIIATILPPE